MKTMTYLLNLTLLVVCTQFAFADAPDWEYDPGAYEFTAWVNANVLDDGEQIADDGDILAAFDASGTVRGIGVQVAGFGPTAGLTMFEVTMGSNADGDEISFQYYDASEDAILGISETLSFATNVQTGDLTDPWVINIGGPDLSCPPCEDEGLCTRRAPGNAFPVARKVETLIKPCENEGF